MTTEPTTILIYTLCSFLILAGFPVEAQAYIPNSRTIFSRVARNNGKGLYVIEQEVQFRSPAEPVTLRERWIVGNGETMRLTVTAPKSAAESYRFDAVYREGKRVAPDLQGSLRTSHVSPEFIESYQHFRSGRGVMEALVRSRVLPTSFLKERPRITAIDKYKYQPEPLVRLGRVDGVVSWAFGEPTPADHSKLLPGAWIEQDAFVLRKLRFPSQAEMNAEKHATFAGAIRLPRERTVAWDNNTVVIHVLSVKPLSDGQGTQLLNPSSLTQTEARAARLPEQPSVKEFYSRFR